jgi:hypothetical protein|tara:strand:- start:774 stop:887 length:114 start_codon:yes stop_codon:yes gene_type:complete
MAKAKNAAEAKPRRHFSIGCRCWRGQLPAVKGRLEEV